MSEANQNINDDNKPSLSDRISQLFRSFWFRLFCCKKPAGENSSSGTQSGDEVDEQLPVDVPSHGETFYIDPATNRVVILG